MRSRLLTSAAALALATTGLLGVSASPANAHCSGHGTHPDRYSAGGISFRNGTFIRSHPHINCTARGQGFPTHGIDVHCAVITGSAWFFVRNTTTGVNGWVRHDTVNWDGGPVPIC